MAQFHISDNSMVGLICRFSLCGRNREGFAWSDCQLSPRGFFHCQNKPVAILTARNLENVWNYPISLFRMTIGIRLRLKTASSHEMLEMYVNVVFIIK